MLSRRRTARITMDTLPLWLALPLGVWLGTDLGYWIVDASSGTTRILVIAVVIAAIAIMGLSMSRPARGRAAPRTPDVAPHDTSLL
jgi:hypothetical protein